MDDQHGTIQIPIVNQSNHPLPAYATEGAAGMDLRAYLPTAPLTLSPSARLLVPTGLFIALPAGFQAETRPRSGLALRHGITVLNAPGTIDADYRGELKVLLINLSAVPFTIQDGDRIAQLIIQRYVKGLWQSVAALETTARGQGGFGSTGMG